MQIKDVCSHRDVTHWVTKLWSDFSDSFMVFWRQVVSQKLLTNERAVPPESAHMLIYPPFSDS